MKKAEFDKVFWGKKLKETFKSATPPPRTLNKDVMRSDFIRTNQKKLEIFFLSSKKNANLPFNPPKIRYLFTFYSGYIITFKAMVHWSTCDEGFFITKEKIFYEGKSWDPSIMTSKQ